MNNDYNRFAYDPINLDIQRSMFNRNHSVKFSFNLGECIPFYCDEVLPGDTFSIDTAKVIRTQPMVAPIMDDVYLDTYYYFVPNRLLWDHWKEFCGENNTDAWTPQVEYSVPQLVIPENGFNTGTIADYLGIPVNVGAGRKVSALPFRAYARIMNEWFRDENLMTPIHISYDDSNITGSNGGNQVTDIEKGGKPFIACKIKDYFSSALPEPQKGPSVKLPLGTDARVYPRDFRAFEPGDTKPADSTAMQFMTVNSDGKFVAIDSGANVRLGATGKLGKISDSSASTPTNIVPTNLFADLRDSTASTVNELRQAFAIQKFFEKLARGGSRYVEYLKVMFGVTSPDFRLQRSEFLGGERIPLNIADVPQTSSTDSVSPQASVAGLSHTGSAHSDFTHSFTEHGYIIGIAVARIHHTYQNGVERHWLRKSNFDYYNPVFANLGEQAIYGDEIFLGNDNVFGYQEAWADYRYKPSRVAGELRSAYAQSLDLWHLADNYSEAPTLSADWIREDKNLLDRALAVTSSVSNQLIADFYIEIDVARPMPLYSIPGLIDHH